MSQELITRYDNLANSPTRWRNRAESLLTSSELLASHSRLFDQSTTFEELPPMNSVDVQVMPIVLMLRAMAIECLFKSMWLQLGEVLTIDGKYIGIPNIPDHDLLKLATAVLPRHSINLEEADSDMIMRLSFYIMRGRYPSHRNWQRTSPRKLRDGRFCTPQYWKTVEDEPRFSNLVEKCRNALPEGPPYPSLKRCDGHCFASHCEPVAREKVGGIL